ncbi:hypothetical protein GSB9_02397 [Flavobacteriaceae bacterium GSB9]|nr:hypothetical protein GSB9_02397 [Flavobacteriaceae bacterium GSB9]
MRKIVSVTLILAVFLSCKNEKKADQEETISIENKENTEAQNGLMLLKGEYVFYNDAAVLQTKADIYGVFITEKSKELNKIAEQYKSEPTDMVEVTIKGKVTNQKDDKILWEKKVDITEIISVSPLSEDKNNVIKLGQE